MPSIFVSYSHNDREDAELIIKLLTRFDEDYDIWWDFQIRSGSNWRESIKNEIRNRDIFIFLMSHDSMASEFCHEELRIAHETGRFLLPIVIEQPIDNSQLPDDVSSYLNDYQYVDLSGDGDKAFELTKMFNALKWYEETIADTSVKVWASEVAKAMNSQASHELNIPDFNTAQTRRARAVQFSDKPPSLANRPQNTTRRYAFMALLIGFVAVLFFGIIFGFSFLAGLVGSSEATALSLTDDAEVEVRIMTRHANSTSIAEMALSATATETQTPTIDVSATLEMQTMIVEQETESDLATSEQETKAVPTTTALFETQSAQLTADAPTITALPTDVIIPTATTTLTPSNTPTSTPNAAEIAQLEASASETAIVQQTSVYETVVAEQQAVATQAPTEIYPEGHLLQFRYNDGSFYMQNTSTDRIRLNRLSFQGLDAEGELVGDVFEGQQWTEASDYRYIDGNGRCVSLEFWQIPEGTVELNPEACEPESNYNALLNMDTDMRSVFWRPASEIIEFAVFWNNQEIARCPTETGFCEVRVGD